MKDYYIGIDGCRGGWVAAILCEKLELRFFESLEDARELIEGASFSLIDMPMGFPSSGKGERSCDREARKHLVRRRMSIFPVPCRQAVYTDSYEEACAVNRSVLGRGLSKQSYNLFPKMREVDSFIGRDLCILKKVSEGHPELSFAKLKGSEMLHSKKSSEGFQERLYLLEEYIPGSSKVISGFNLLYKKKTLSGDDILDSVVLALAAASVSSGNYQFITSEAGSDERGIPMMIFVPFISRH